MGVLVSASALPDHRLDQAETNLQRVVALPKFAETPLDALGVPASLVEMTLEPVAVLATGRHRDLRLELAHQRDLRSVRLVQVLHDLLLLLHVTRCHRELLLEIELRGSDSSVAGPVSPSALRVGERSTATRLTSRCCPGRNATNLSTVVPAAGPGSRGRDSSPRPDPSAATNNAFEDRGRPRSTCAQATKPMCFETIVGLRHGYKTWVKSLDDVQRHPKGDGRTAADRLRGTGLSPDATAAAVRRRGEAQLGQSSPTVVWRKSSKR